MDYAIDFLKGFFFDEENVQQQQDQDLADQEIRISNSNKSKGSNDNDGRSKSRVKSTTKNNHRDVESGEVQRQSSKSRPSPRTISVVTDIFWTKSQDVPLELKESTSSSSSSDSKNRPKNYNSDTSSTQSSSGGEDNLKKSSSRASQEQQRRERGRDRRYKSRRDVMALEDGESHLQLFSHGKTWTIVGIVATWIGFTCSYLTFTSTSFVTLSTPFYVDPVWDEVHDVGMINLQLCYNETHMEGMTGCTVHRLTAEDIDDTMFQTARSMSFLAILLGGFMSVFLTSAVYWYSINLRPLGFGYLLAYFLQSFTFLFFDSTLCNEHDCSVSTGGKLSLFASLSWIVSCIAAARMDSYKFQKKMERRRARSPSRSQSPQKKSSASSSPRKKRTLERRATDGTSPFSDSDSFGSTDEEGLLVGEASNWTCPGRRFASNGCEIIHGIQDPEALRAWAARSPKVEPSQQKQQQQQQQQKQPRRPDSTPSRPSRRPRSERPRSTTDVVTIESTASSVGSPIVPSRRNRALERMGSPSKRVDPLDDNNNNHQHHRQSTSSSSNNNRRSATPSRQRGLTSSSSSSSTANASAIERALHNDERPQSSRRRSRSSSSPRKQHRDHSQQRYRPSTSSSSSQRKQRRPEQSPAPVRFVFPSCNGDEEGTTKWNI